MIWTRRIFDKKVGRKSFLKMSNVYALIIVSRSNSTSVISSSSWTRRIAKPRLKFAARMVFQETFLRIHKRLLRQLTKECSITWIDFSIAGNIPVQVSTGKLVIENGDRDNNRSWAKWLKGPNSFSIFSCKTLNEKTIGGNVREEGPCAQSI